MFELLDHHRPGDCGCRKFERGESYTFKSTERDKSGKLPSITINGVDEYFAWLLSNFGHLPGSALVDNFSMSGCGAWIGQFEEIHKFQEYMARYRAAKDLGIQPARNFDDAPVDLLEGLIMVASELPAALREKAKRENGNKA